jgi:Mor family transcriptional regulator
MEMLYDTLYPTEPQNDLEPAQTERNEEIRARYEAGETGASLARAYSISEQRVNQIIRGRRS